VDPDPTREVVGKLRKRDRECVARRQRLDPRDCLGVRIAIVDEEVDGDGDSPVRLPASPSPSRSGGASVSATIRTDEASASPLPPPSTTVADIETRGRPGPGTVTSSRCSLPGSSLATKLNPWRPGGIWTS